ncbi:MAG TPA: hypothetical protein VK829_13740 [Terriglobales bacterium]|jgi:hypothetical protein|nr:hypothetical protein [Terriglobales bacterium]HWY53566.1 hypothetical protein [Terriglobales bacterium]
MNSACEEPTCLLRKALLGNALFSALSGLTLLFAQKSVLRILGLFNRVSLVVLGVGLIIFAATLVVNARRQRVKTSDAWVAVLMDVAWVLTSYVLIFVLPFSMEGKWVIGVVAELVLLFAILQFMGIRRIRDNEQSG